MTSLDSILNKIETEISDIQYPGQPESLYSPIKYVLSLGGKRIRPILTLIACNIYSEEIDQAVKSAIGIEVFHNFTLLHDDLMDEADKRRNKPTVHKVWNPNTAILSGDAMMIAAYQLMTETPKEHLKEVLDLFTSTALDICGGQQYDMLFEKRLDVAEEEYIEMIKMKTAVLLACSLKTGAILGGASPKDADLLYDYGVNIGLAFQLQDDLLDVFGNTEVFGKNIGGDILCNKKTFLLINAIKCSDDSQRKELISWIEREDFEPKEKIAFFTSLYSDLQIKELTENKIKTYHNKAEECLNNLSVSPERLQILREFSDSLMVRES